MAIERRTRLHRVEIMAHGPRVGGQFEIESYEWDDIAGAIVPGSGRLLPPEAIAFDSGDAGTAWSRVRELIDLALVAETNAAVADGEVARNQRDAANSERDAAMQTAAKATQARDAMRTALTGRLEDIQAALAADELARAAQAEVAERGT